MDIVKKQAPLSWGLIGASTIADEMMIPAVQQSGGTFKTVYSGSRSRASELAQKHGIATATDDLDELLADAEIDAVFISSRNDHHHGQVLAAAAAGKHILCEKPITLSVAAAREMVDAAAGAGVVLAVNHHQREHPVSRALRDTIRGGALGKVCAVRVQHAGRLREDLRTWRLEDPEAGGGVELDLTVHDADLLRFLLGQNVAEVAAVSAREYGAAATTHTMSTLLMEDGTFVSMHEGFNVPYARHSIEVHGEHATAICVGHTAQDVGGELWLSRDQDGTREPVEVVQDHSPYLGVTSTFTAAVVVGGNPSASGEDGLRSLQVALAVRDAGLSGQRVAIDLSA
jgi:1,5-anhydro-D-fructose reductase (1,5-anhydro-D-mannitol-forming)